MQRVLIVFIILTASLLASSTSADVPQMINYQGLLTNSSGDPLDTTVQMEFRICADSTGGTCPWIEVHPAVEVTNGSFNVILGSITPITTGEFSDDERWLGIMVGDEAMPYTRLVSVPYAHHAMVSDTAAFALSGGGESHWTLTGNLLSTNAAYGIFRGGVNNIYYGTTAGWTTTNLGGVNCTTGVDGENYGYMTIAGGEGNAAWKTGATVGGGAVNSAQGTRATIGGGWANEVTDNYGTIAGGVGNIADLYATVGGGQNNQAMGVRATIAGGQDNEVTGDLGAVGGGIGNSAGLYATVAGGHNNEATGSRATVGGGFGNVVTGGSGATIAGGYENYASGTRATVCGGWTDSATGDNSFVGGGVGNNASADRSGVAAGYRNKATHGYSFVGGGHSNEANGYISSVLGGTKNVVDAFYSSIPGGYCDTIAATATHSYLFGIGSKLTHDSTFMVDMPHIRFGDEVSGYEFPAADGTAGQVLQTNGSGTMSWGSAGGDDGDWTQSGGVLFTGFESGVARAGNTLHGSFANTHVAFGDNCVTGAPGYQEQWCTVGGGEGNTASGGSSTVSGGMGNTASGILSFVGGGLSNTASDNSSVVCGGQENESDGAMSFVGGGNSNQATVSYATITGGFGNSADSEYSFIGGGSGNTVAGDHGVIGGGTGNTASGKYSAVGGGWNGLAEGYGSTVSGGGINRATATHATVGGGFLNEASGNGATIAGGTDNFVGGDKSAILGGEFDTITAAADYSYLFGMHSKLTADSTFMVDMPHIRFGDEASGYEFPAADGSGGQVMTTDGGGQLSWSDAGGGLSLPYSDSLNSSNDLLTIVNKGTGEAIHAEARGSEAAAIYGRASATGMPGSPAHNYGGYFEAMGLEGKGVYGWGNPGVYGAGSVNGVYGESAGNGKGVVGVSPTIGVYGEATSTTGLNVIGGQFVSNSSMGAGVYGTGFDGGHFESTVSGGSGLYAKGNAVSKVACKFQGKVVITGYETGNTVMELGEGLDYAEGFDVTAQGDIGPGSVLIIDTDNPGQLTLSTKAYDARVAGIVAGANGLGSGVRLGAGQFDYDVALAGRVYCNVDASNGEIRPGDLLTTSDIPGYAMKAVDLTRIQGAILGKAMEPLIQGEKGRILVLVTLQ